MAHIQCMLVLLVFLICAIPIEPRSQNIGIEHGSQARHYGDRRQHPRKILMKNAVIDTSLASSLRSARFGTLDDNEEKSSYLLHLRDPITENRKQAIEEILVEQLRHYLPHNTYVVQASNAQLYALQNSEHVLWIQIFEPALKVNLGHSSNFRSWSFQNMSGQDYTVGEAPLERDIEMLVSLISQRQRRSLEETTKIGMQWIQRAQESSVAEFEIEGTRGDRVLLRNITFEGSSIRKESQLYRFSLWIAAQDLVIDVALRPTWELSNKYSKLLLQEDSETAPPGGPLFERHNLKGQGSVIGIGDSGVNADSCFFRDPDNAVTYTTITPSTQESTMALSNHRKIGLYIVSSSGDKVDRQGHGSHVAGSLSGQSTSVWQDINGMAPDSRLAFFDIEKGTTVSLPGSLDTSFFPFMSAVGAKIHSNSWGSPTNFGEYTLSCVDVDRYVWENKDALILFSAGNHGLTGSNTITSPGTAKNVISVGASLNSKSSWESNFCAGGTFEDDAMCQSFHTWGDDLEDDLAVFSSVGFTIDGRIKPDVVAPGNKVVSASLSTCSGDASDLAIEQGTSMATPVLAGTIVLVRQYFEEGYYPSGKPDASNSIQPSASLLKAITINDAFSMSRRRRVKDNALFHDVLPATPNQYAGFGRVAFGRGRWFDDQTDVHHKLWIPRADNGRDDPELTNTGEQHEYTYCVSHVYSKHPPRFTLVWTDWPSSPAASVALVNDLDLTVYSHSGRILHYANGGNTYDRRNTVERVELPGEIQPNVELRVVVHASNIPHGPQPYSLVASGRIVEGQCSQEFPGGFIPADRYVDLSTASSNDDSSTHASFIDLQNLTTQIVIGVVAILLLACGCCCFCSIYFDDSCCRCCRKRAKMPATDSSDLENDEFQTYHSSINPPTNQHGIPSGGRPSFSYRVNTSEISRGGDSHHNRSMSGPAYNVQALPTIRQ